jgi:hypothetical protein
MAKRLNTHMCTFAMDSPRITAYNIHEWVFETLKIPEEDLCVLQIDGPSRKVYLKFSMAKDLRGHLNTLQGDHEHKHETREVSTVTVYPVGLGHRSVRVASLPPEIKDQVLSASLSQYDTIKQVTGEKWSHSYRYNMPSGVRLVHIKRNRQISSQLQIEGHNYLWWAAGDVFQLRRNWPPFRNVSLQTKFTPTSHAHQDKNRGNNSTAWQRGDTTDRHNGLRQTTVASGTATNNIQLNDTLHTTPGICSPWNLGNTTRNTHYTTDRKAWNTTIKHRTHWVEEQRSGPTQWTTGVEQRTSSPRTGRETQSKPV